MTDLSPRLGQQIILPDNVRIDVKTEENPDDARHRRWQQTGIIFAALTLFSITFFVTMWVACFSATPDAELKKAAIAIFVTLAGALGGFLGGRATK